METPPEDDKSYESLYPRGVGAVPGEDEPDFHELSSFGEIDLTVLGYVEDGEHSEIWRHALGKSDKTFQ